MGGGDLNLKKSWHPNTMKNQERVWKAEQADAAEKRKLAELKQEISAERDREELHRIGQSSGVLPGGGLGISGGAASNKKLEWMYKGTENLVNREEYLMGRQVDKSFEAQVAAEREAQQQALVGVTKPKNHVEHECIPFSIRQFHGIKVSEEQVDLQRKISEDPLMAIRQREMETRKKLLENPVKLKEIHRLLRTDSKIRGSSATETVGDASRKGKSKKSKKSSKKSKKSKSKKKRLHSRNSSSDEDDEAGENEADLDAILAKKYKQLQQGDEDGGGHMDIDKLLKVKYNKLSEELDKMGGAHSKSKKKKKKHDKDQSPVPVPVASVRRNANPFSKTSDPSRAVVVEDPPAIRRAPYPGWARRSSPSPPKNRFNQSPAHRSSRSPVRNSRRQSPMARGSSRDDRKRRSSSRDQSNRSKDLKRRHSRSRSPAKRRKSPIDRARRQSRSSDRRLSTNSSYPGRKLTTEERRAPSSRSPNRSRRSSSKTNPSKRSRPTHETNSSPKTSPNINQHRNQSPPPAVTLDKFKTVSSKKPVTHSRSSSSSSSTSAASSSSSSDSSDTDSEAEAAKRAALASRNYGLVTAGGEKIAIKPTSNTRPSADEAQKSTSSSRKPAQLRPPERPAKLSEAEKQRRLVEMQSNAEWRDDERRRNVTKYREQERREIDERAKETFDRDYINKELQKAMANQNSVESRLRANKNNIQRSRGAMDSNFAKR